MSTNSRTLDELTILLKDKAGEQTAIERTLNRGEDYFNPADESGGNFDDAYFMGTEDGRIEMARRVLDVLECHRVQKVPMT